MSRRRIDLRIDELVLDGVAGDPRAIRGATERELARLLAEDGIPRTLEHSHYVAGVRTEARVSGGDAVGAQVARAVYRGVSR